MLFGLDLPLARVCSSTLQTILGLKQGDFSYCVSGFESFYRFDPAPVMSTEVLD